MEKVSTMRLDALAVKQHDQRLDQISEKMTLPTQQQNLDSWRYIIVLSKCGFAFLHHGTLKAYGVLIPSLVIQLQTSYATVGLVTTMQCTVTFLACPLAQQLSKRFGTRLVAAWGGFLAALSVTLTSLSTSPVTMGLLFSLAGFGASMLYQTSHVVVNEHFGDRFGAVNSLSQIFCTVGSIVMSFFTTKLLEAYGSGGALLLLGALTAHEIVFGATLRPPRVERYREDGDDSNDTLTKSVTPGNRRSTYDDQEGNPNHRPNPDQTTRSISETLLNGAKKFFAVDALQKELALVLVFFPCQIIHDFTFIGWCLFVVSYGLSVGLDSFQAPLLAVSGAAGGFVGRLTLAILLHLKPSWSQALYALNVLIFLLALFLYQAGSSVGHLVWCSLLAGFGLYAAPTSYYGAISTTVSEEAFPELLSVSFFISGISIPVAGVLTGYLYDVTQSFQTVFMIFGGLLALNLILCSAYFTYKRARRRASSSPTRS